MSAPIFAPEVAPMPLITTFHLHETWLDADHLAFRVTKAKKNGTPDYRYHAQTYTIPVSIVLAAAKLGDALYALTKRGDLCTVGNRENVLLGEAMLDRLHTMHNFDDVAEVYPVARDYVIDHAHERDAFVESMRIAREAGPEWQQLTPQGV